MAELGELHSPVEHAKVEIAKPFLDETILEEKSRWMVELNVELDMDRWENEIVDGVEEQREKRDGRTSSRDGRYERTDREHR